VTSGWLERGVVYTRRGFDDADNHVAGAVEVHIQYILQYEPDVARHVRQGSPALRQRLTAELEMI
jgi:hypothetical protein